MSKEVDRQLGRPIAERVLTCGKRKRTLIVRLGMPRKVPRSDWACPYQIVGLRDSRVEDAYGVDSVQALIMALESIRRRLERSRVSCTWMGGEEGDAGFARMVPGFFGFAFSTRINRLIDRELDRFGRSLRKRLRAGRKA
jgi:hypothetical protein